MTEVLRKRVEFCGEDDITSRPDCQNALPRAAVPSMKMDEMCLYFQEFKMKLRSRSRGEMWIENTIRTVESFQGFVQLSIK